MGGLVGFGFLPVPSFLGGLVNLAARFGINFHRVNFAYHSAECSYLEVYMTVTVDIAENIKSLNDLQAKFNLRQTEDDDFFTEMSFYLSS
jgi:hypothetical protein